MKLLAILAWAALALQPIVEAAYKAAPGDEHLNPVEYWNKYEHCQILEGSGSDTGYFGDTRRNMDDANIIEWYAAFIKQNALKHPQRFAAMGEAPFFGLIGWNEQHFRCSIFSMDCKEAGAPKCEQVVKFVQAANQNKSTAQVLALSRKIYFAALQIQAIAKDYDYSHKTIDDVYDGVGMEANKLVAEFSLKPDQQADFVCALIIKSVDTAINIGTSALSIFGFPQGINKIFESLVDIGRGFAGDAIGQGQWTTVGRPEPPIGGGLDELPIQSWRGGKGLKDVPILERMNDNFEGWWHGGRQEREEEVDPDAPPGPNEKAELEDFEWRPINWGGRSDDLTEEEKAAFAEEVANDEAAWADWEAREDGLMKEEEFWLIQQQAWEDAHNAQGWWDWFLGKLKIGGMDIGEPPIPPEDDVNNWRSIYDEVEDLPPRDQLNFLNREGDDDDYELGIAPEDESPRVDESSSESGYDEDVIDNQSEIVSDSGSSSDSGYVSDDYRTSNCLYEDCSNEGDPSSTYLAKRAVLGPKENALLARDRSQRASFTAILIRQAWGLFQFGTRLADAQRPRQGGGVGGIGIGKAQTATGWCAAYGGGVPNQLGERAQSMKEFISNEKYQVKDQISMILEKAMMGNIELKRPLAISATAYNVTTNGTLADHSGKYQNGTRTYQNGTHLNRTYDIQDNELVRTSRYLSSMMQAKGAEWPKNGGFPNRQYHEDIPNARKRFRESMISGILRNSQCYVGCTSYQNANNSLCLAGKDLKCTKYEMIKAESRYDACKLMRCHRTSKDRKGKARNRCKEEVCDRTNAKSKIEEAKQAYELCQKEEIPKKTPKNILSGNRACTHDGFACQTACWTTRPFNNREVPLYGHAGMQKYGLTPDDFRDNSIENYRRYGNKHSAPLKNFMNSALDESNASYIALPVCVSDQMELGDYNPLNQKASSRGFNKRLPCTCGDWRSSETANFMSSIGFGPNQAMASDSNAIETLGVVCPRLNILHPQVYSSSGGTYYQDKGDLTKMHRIHINKQDKRCNSIKNATTTMSEDEANRWFCLESEDAKELFKVERWWSWIPGAPAGKEWLPSHQRLCKKYVKKMKKTAKLSAKEEKAEKKLDAGPPPDDVSEMSIAESELLDEDELKDYEAVREDDKIYAEVVDDDFVGFGDDIEN